MSSIASGPWTDEKVSQLKELLNARLTAREIGLKLHFSKNAVIGKVHRLGLKFNSVYSLSTPRLKKPPKIKAPVVPPAKLMKADRTLAVSTPVVFIDDTDPVPLIELKPRCCKYPVDRDDRTGEWLMCARPRDPEQPYCDYHTSVCYRTHLGKYK